MTHILQKAFFKHALVALKYGALPGALENIRALTGEDTTVMSLMNGVDSEEIIAKEIDTSHILHALIKVASHKEENGYCFNPETTIGIVFGELTAPYQSERVQAIEDLFAADTGVCIIVQQNVSEKKCGANSA